MLRRLHRCHHRRLEPDCATWPATERSATCREGGPQTRSCWIAERRSPCNAKTAPFRRSGMRSGSEAQHSCTAPAADEAFPHEASAGPIVRGRSSSPQWEQAAELQGGRGVSRGTGVSASSGDGHVIHRRGYPCGRPDGGEGAEVHKVVHIGGKLRRHGADLHGRAHHARSPSSEPCARRGWRSRTSFT